MSRVVKVRLSDDVYWAVLKQAGSTRRLSQAVEELLKRALAAEGLEIPKTSEPKTSEPKSPKTQKTEEPSSLSSPVTKSPEVSGTASLKAPEPELSKTEREEAGEGVPPRAEAPTPAGRPGRPDLLTAGQLDFIRALLERNRWSWLDVKDVLEFDTGLVLPDDPSQLTREAASRVIDALRSWERKPSSEELKKARQIMAQLPREVLERLNLPERASEVKRYHVALLEKAWARQELERARRGGGR